MLSLYVILLRLYRKEAFFVMQALDNRSVLYFQTILYLKGAAIARRFAPYSFFLTSSMRHPKL